MKLKLNKTPFLIDEPCSLADARFLILPIPYEKTTSYGKGTGKGPAAILDSSWQVEFWDEEAKREVWKEGIVTLAPFNCKQGEKSFFKNLGKEVAGLLAMFNGIPIFLGGEHSITQGLLPPFQKKYKDLSILHFDAHADLRPEYEGSPHSHASALYPASRTTKTVQIGIRSVSQDEARFTNSGKVRTYLMHENLNFAKLEKNILKALSDTVYLTIDVDGFDPSVMLGTGTPQPGGFMWYDALKLFKVVCKKKKVVGIDVVEVAPIKGSPITEFNAAKLVYRLMGYLS
ncbi:MAG: agmatinase [Elusimicrobia bacterium RIFOXYA12_FULL_51_18]|nr:MAG: agmatinase [Elusimicrobia bacterium RIFOXYA12_FULL_51_18]OGS30237.1 MAG: agmatinase [Elusimicrobia bacterium RIFOXYA2_FULL_53_38]